MSKTQKKWYAILPKEVKGQTPAAEVRIFGEIGWEVVAEDFIRDLDALGPDAELDIRINSVGGSVFEGLHIYNRIKMHAGEVSITVEGLAASMASVIAMAGDLTVMVEASMMMIHNPSTAAWGDARDMQKTAETLAQIKETLLDAYQSKTGRDREELAQMLDDETWMTAQEAVDAGFADEVMGASEADEDLDIAACLRSHDYSKFRNAPTFEAVAPAESADEPSAPETPAATAATIEGGDMPHEDKAALEAARKEGVEQAKAAERERRNEVRTVFTGFDGEEHVALLESCLDDDTITADAARQKLLAALRSGEEQTGTGSPSVHVVEDQAEKVRAAANDWIGYRAGIRNDEGRKIVVAGDNPFRGARLLDVARIALEYAGQETRGMTPKDIVNAAITHGVSDFPNIMQDAMHKTLLNGFSMAGDTWRNFCATGDLSDFRPHYRHLEGSFSDLATVNESGEIEDGTLDDTRKETITGATKGRILNLSGQAIINDDMSVFSGAARMMGRAAARSVENDVYALLALNSGLGPVMSDGNPLFDAAHDNVGTGALSTGALAIADDTIRSQKFPNADSEADEFVDPSSPFIFVGPLALAKDADVFNEAQYDHDGATVKNFQKPNKSRGLLSQSVGTPRMTGAPWYLFPNPEEMPVIEVGFVQGQETPELEQMEAFRQWGVAWRVIYHYGIAAVNWLGCYRSTGA